MKLLHTLFLLAFFSNSYSQDQVIKKGDTLYYRGEKYYKGLIIRFGTPSRDTLCINEPAGQETNKEYQQRLKSQDYYYPCKDFAFAWLGSGLAQQAVSGIPAGYAGMDAEVIRIRKLSTKYCIIVDMLVHRNLPQGFFTNSRKERRRSEATPEHYKSLSAYSVFTIDVKGAMDNQELTKTSY